MPVNKKIIILLTIIICTIFVVVFLVLTSNVPKSNQQIPTEPLTSEDYTTPRQTDISNLSKEVSNSTSQIEKNKIINDLPIKIDNFKTSVGLTTNINIYSLDSDPKQVIHLEIYGINYYLSDAVNTNPQAVAFLESFNEIKKVLSTKKIDLNNLQIIYGTRDYIQTTSENWIKEFKLLP